MEWYYEPLRPRDMLNRKKSKTFLWLTRELCYSNKMTLHRKRTALVLKGRGLNLQFNMVNMFFLFCFIFVILFFYNKWQQKPITNRQKLCWRMTRESIVEGVRAGREGKSGDTGRAPFRLKTPSYEKGRADCRALEGSGENFVELARSFALSESWGPYKLLGFHSKLLCLLGHSAGPLLSFLYALLIKIPSPAWDHWHISNLPQIPLNAHLRWKEDHLSLAHSCKLQSLGTSRHTIGWEDHVPCYFPAMVTSAKWFQ